MSPVAPDYMIYGPTEEEMGVVNGTITCPKCKGVSGDDWSQCDGRCPMPSSPHHDAAYEKSWRGPHKPDRVSRILVKLQRAWEAQSDLRLLQFLINLPALRPIDVRTSGLFYLPDETIEAALDVVIATLPAPARPAETDDISY